MIELYKTAVQVIETMPGAFAFKAKSGFLLTKLKYNEVQMISTERLCTIARHTKNNVLMFCAMHLLVEQRPETSRSTLQGLWKVFCSF